MYEGQCRHSWLEAMRASSAAPYFFEEFPLSTALRFQDGAIVANNPSIIAMQEAQCLWPGRPVDVLVSLREGRRCDLAGVDMSGSAVTRCCTS